MSDKRVFEADQPDRIVFIPGSDVDERPKRIADKPARPTPRPVDDSTPKKWSPPVKKKREIVSESQKSVFRLLIMFLLTVASISLVLYLIVIVAGVYGIDFLSDVDLIPKF